MKLSVFFLLVLAAFAPPTEASENVTGAPQADEPMAYNSFRGDTEVSVGFIYVSIEASFSVFFLGHVSHHLFCRDISILNSILLAGVALVYINSFGLIGLSLRNDSNYQCLTAGMVCGTYWFLQVLTYLFLVEKQRLVQFPQLPRQKDKRYIFNMFLVTIYLVFTFLYLGAFEFTFSLVGGVCQFGNGHLNFLPVLLTADFIFSAWWTLSFIYPLLKMVKQRKSKEGQSQNGADALLQAAKNNALGCVICTASTAINLAILYNVPGYYPYYCNAGCNLDMLINLSALTWVSTKKPKKPNANNSRLANNIKMSTSNMSPASKKSTTL